jgi:hypothetical protein
MERTLARTQYLSHGTWAPTPGLPVSRPHHEQRHRYPRAGSRIEMRGGTPRRRNELTFDNRPSQRVFLTSTRQTQGSTHSVATLDMRLARRETPPSRARRAGEAFGTKAEDLGGWGKPTRARASSPESLIRVSAAWCDT